MNAQIELPPEPRSARSARRFLEDVVGDAQLLEIAALLVSELVTNAILHARTNIQVTVDQADGVLRVEVSDESPAMPSRRDYGDEATTGRGLGLVSALASDWGTTVNGHGKVIWFELR
jgi:anti-sigma regulatory factor (Ser/Thr protein kinase)